MQVTSPQGTSDPVSADERKFAPAWLLFDPGGRKYIAAVHLDGSYLLKSGAVPGLTTKAAKPGEVILLFGTGFGAVNPSRPASDVVQQPSLLANPLTLRIGGLIAKVAFAGRVGSGLDQFNVTVPDLPDGDHLVVAEIGGTRTQYSTFITVQR